MCASRSSALARRRVIQRKNKTKWENRKYERSRGRIVFLKTEPAHWPCAILSSVCHGSSSAPLAPRGVGTASVARPTRSVTFTFWPAGLSRQVLIE
jgi:hypothetical protein